MSTEEESQAFKRRRIQKACDRCRSRKIKCDGQQPCQSCVGSGLSCEYNHVEKKREPSKRTVGTQSIKSLDERVKRMESLFTTLVEKLSNGTKSPRTPLAYPSEKMSSGSGSSTPVPSSYPYSLALNSTKGSPANSVSNGNAFHHRELNFDNKLDVPKEEDSKYFGSQSSFSILSPRSLIWLSKRSGDPTLVPQFKYLLSQKHTIFHAKTELWTNPIERNELTPLPPKDVLDQIVAVFSREFSYASILISKEEISALVNIHYQTEAGLKARKLTNSEKLILNAIVAIGATVIAEHEFDGKNFTQLLIDMKKLEELHSKNAIHYYLKIAVFGEGIKGIIAILFLILLTTTPLTPQSNYMLTSVVIRFAQEMGLHRKESLLALPVEERKRRTRIWWLCYIMDRLSCLKCGNPPIINDRDVSNLDFNDLQNLVFDGVPQEIAEKVKSPMFDYKTSTLNDDLKLSLSSDTWCDSIYSLILVYYYPGLGNFISRSYDKLFNPSALTGKNTYEIWTIIQDLGNELEQVNLKIPESIRPGSSFQFQEIPIEGFKKIILLHFTYHLQVMLINRMAFKRSWSYNDSDSHVDDKESMKLPLQEHLINKCLGSAKEILKLVTYMNPFWYYAFDFSTFLFFSASFTLLTGCIEYPTSSTARSDLDLISKSGESFFQKYLSSPSALDSKLNYNMVTFIVKYFLRIGILIYNNNNADQIDTVSLNEELLFHADKLGLDKFVVYDSSSGKETAASTNVAQTPDELINELNNPSNRSSTEKMKLNNESATDSKLLGSDLLSDIFSFSPEYSDNYSLLQQFFALPEFGLDG